MTLTFESALERLYLASQALGLAANRNPPIGELHAARLRELQVRELCERFPSFGTLAIREILERP